MFQKLYKQAKGKNGKIRDLLKQLAQEVKKLEEAFLFAELCLERKNENYFSWAIMLIHANKENLETDDEWTRFHELAQKMKCSASPKQAVAALNVAEEVLKRAKGTPLESARQEEYKRALEIKILTQQSNCS